MPLVSTKTWLAIALAIAVVFYAYNKSVTVRKALGGQG